MSEKCKECDGTGLLKYTSGFKGDALECAQGCDECGGSGFIRVDQPRPPTETPPYNDSDHCQASLDYWDGKRDHTPREPEPVVYLLKMGPYYKIGATTNFPNRYKALTATALPYPVEHVSSVRLETRKEAFQLENKLHRMFASKRMNGEWFKLSPYDVKSIIQRSA